MQTSHDLYPPIEPYSSGYLDVDATHTLYWEQSGNPDGAPIVFLHGGPGGGTSPVYRQFFNPEHYRIIIFDQRGSGKSTPLGELSDNTTAHLIADIETLRAHLSIEHWHVFGGSWGSTLALLYAQNHPTPCLSLILRGIFLCEQPEINWFLYGMKTIFPAAWETFVHHIPPLERDDLLQAYYKRLTSTKNTIVEAAAQHWANYESACAYLRPKVQSDAPKTQNDKDHDLAIARIEAHYFINEVIAPADSILNKIDIIRHIPTTIIQGRYDIICPIISAHKLKNVWAEAKLVIVPNGGHSALDPAVRSALIQVCNNLTKA